MSLKLAAVESSLEDETRDVRRALALWLTIGPGMLRESSVTRAAAAARWPRLVSQTKSSALHSKTNGLTPSTAIQYTQTPAPLRGHRKRASETILFWTVFLFWEWILVCLSFRSLSGNGREDLFGEGAARVREGSINTQTSQVSGAR